MIKKNKQLFATQIIDMSNTAYDDILQFFENLEIDTSDTAYDISEAVRRIRERDSTLRIIFICLKRHTDEEMAELIECMLAYPDAVEYVFLEGNLLTDETGVKLARYLIASSTIRSLTAFDNRFGKATYLAMAAALWTNTSLGTLWLYANQEVDKVEIDALFVNALWSNPNRPDSNWILYQWNRDDFDRLKAKAEEQSKSCVDEEQSKNNVAEEQLKDNPIC